MNALAVEVAARTLGVVCGTGVSLALAEPSTRWGLVKRGMVSVAIGYAFADVLADWMGWDMIYTNRQIAASFASAFVGWHGAHALIRFVQAFRKS